jgi:hypothetical protein
VSAIQRFHCIVIVSHEGASDVPRGLLTNHEVGDNNEQYVWDEAKSENIYQNFGYEEW